MAISPGSLRRVLLHPDPVLRQRVGRQRHLWEHLPVHLRPVVDLCSEKIGVLDVGLLVADVAKSGVQLPSPYVLIRRCHFGESLVCVITRHVGPSSALWLWG